MAYDSTYDASGYRHRLGALRSREAAIAGYMGAQNIAASQSQLERERMRAESDLYGASTGQGVMGLRTARYGADDLNQRATTEAELMRQIEEQLLREQLRDTYGRGAEYNLAADQGKQQFDAIENASEADDYERRKNKAKHDLEIAGKATGIATSAAGNMIKASSERDLKTDIRRPSDAEQDAALRSIAPSGVGRLGAALDREGARTEAALRRAGPMETIDVGRLGAELDREGAVTDRQLRALEGQRYRYRAGVSGGPTTPDGPRFGPMADDLARTDIGRTMLVDTPRGRAIDTGSAAIGSLSLAARANRRVDELARRLGDELDRQEPPEWTRGR